MSVPVFYVPTLLRKAAPAGIPPGVAFFSCGLAAAPEATPVPEETRAAEKAAAGALPLKPEEARVVLDEMLRLGEDLGGGDAFRHVLLFDEETAADARAAEAAALDAFAATGETPAVPDWGVKSALEAAAEADALRKALVDSQKILLLVHALEERSLEIAGAAGRLRDAGAAFAASLGIEGETEDGFAALLPDALLLDDGARHNVPWRNFTDAALPFLPSGAALFTASESVALDLRESGMLQPFPEDRAFLCRDWPQDLVLGALYASLPGWRLVGRRRPLPERPWLDREVEIIVARPGGGWTAQAL